MKLFEEYSLGTLTLKNRMAMAPMTRSRATPEHVPTPIMAQYYGDRASTGLLITEGTAPSPNGVGYPRIPGIWNQEQVEGWKPVTQAVHDKGGAIFVQVMHTGRIGHPDNMPEGAEIVAPSAIALKESKMWSDKAMGNEDMPTAREMTQADIDQAKEEFVQAAKNAIAAGFDGVELHGANGYLLDQFINPGSNQRTDNYGGSAENRIRFVVEVAQAVVAAIGAEKVGIRLSPQGAFNEVLPFEGAQETFSLLATELGKLSLVYLHLVNHEAMGAPKVPEEITDAMKANFGGTIIISGGYDKDRGEADLQAGKGDLVAYGRPQLANPDLAERFKAGAELNAPNFDTFYTPGEPGYNDYPKLAAAEQA